jgi:DNA-binding MarR family transcriptional regulator
MSKPERRPTPAGTEIRAASVAAGITDLVGALVRLWPRETSLTADFVLAHLERDGPHRLTELAEVAGITQPSMTGLVARLTASGLVERRADAGDRRVVLVAITPAGIEAIGRRRRATTALVAEAVTALEADQIAALEDALPALLAITARTDGNRPAPPDTEPQSA